jgi:putative ubiquitin-RnfH superfamily antitoxin RatB of RatAB toxin-antitoxin module
VKISVVYALPDRQIIRDLQVSEGATVADALVQSGIFENFPSIDAEHAIVGIYGKVTARNARLKSGDRVEIYRPLREEPKEARRKRAGKR